MAENVKAKKEKIKKTPKQKFKIFLRVLLVFVLIIAIIAGATALVNVVCIKSSRSFIDKSISTISYKEQLTPELDEDGCYTFTTDNDFKVLHLTDIHIGSGYLASKKDSMAINAVASMITEEAPDLVVVTGDIAYPVPFQAGTFNNKESAVTFARLMEKLGVYWCLGFGNHDTEAYSYFSREDIARLYENKDKYPHCLFQAGSEDVDGYGNYAIKVKNTKGEITQAFVVFDSHSYTDNDYFGIMWKYDAVHKNQIDWYNNLIANMTKENNGVTPKSIAFLHIPIMEVKDAYNEYRDNDFKDTENTKFMYGDVGEHNEIVYSSSYNNGLFDAFEKSNSTKALFFGHDHLNSFSLMYKGIQLGYGYSVDYLAYAGIAKYGAQRGCNVITIKPDGTYTAELQNYYQDKYQTVKPKEAVNMGSFYDE